jgi:hypothetical protein
MADKNQDSEIEVESQDDQGEVDLFVGLSEDETETQDQSDGGESLPKLTSVQLAKLLEAQPELAEALADTEAIKRRVQSEADKRLDRFRREQEAQAAQQKQQAQAAEEQQRLEEMDDEDYGRYVREQVRQQQAAQTQIQQNMSAAWQKEGLDLLNAIPDSQLRERVNSATYGSWEEFRNAANEARIEATVAQRLAKAQKTHTEAATKEETAQEVESASSFVQGTGRPVSSMTAFRKKTEQEQWREALGELFGKK